MLARTMAVTTIFVLGVSLAVQAQAPAKPLSAYEQLDNSKLADALSSLGMASLLQQLSEELKESDPPDSAYAAGEAMVCQAQAIQQSDPEKFIADVTTATKQYEKVIELASKAPAPANKTAANRAALKLFRYKLRLADLQGNVRIQPFVDRMDYMQAGEEDLARVVQMTEEASKSLQLLHRAINDKITDIDDAATRVTVGPALEEMELTISYRMGYVDLYRGMALRDPAERTRTLTRAVTSVEKTAAQEDNENGLKYWSALIAARASRELKQYARAMDFLKIINSATDAEVPCRLHALFEQVRCLTEKGDFEQAKAAADDFLKKATDILGPGGKITPEGAITRDVRYAMLMNYVYSQWAAAVRATDARKADEYLGEAQKPLLKFMADHPEQADALAEMLVKKFGDIDPAKSDQLNSMMLLAAARMEAGKYKEGAPEYEKAIQKALALLSKALARTDPITMQVIDDIRRLDGFLRAKLGETGIATRRFRDIATSRPTDPRTFPDILNWAILANNTIQDKNERSEPVPAANRQELAEALEYLFRNPAAANNPKATEWRFSLAWQYDKLADGAEEAKKPELLKKAIDNYRLVGKDQPDYMEAQFWACENSVDLLSVTKDATARKTMATDLIKVLQNYAADCAKEAAPLKDDKAREPRYKQLRDWGSRAALLAALVYYEFLGMPAEGVKAYENIAKDWDGTDAVRQAAKTLIQIAVLENRTNDAIKMVDEFRVKYPQDAAALIRLVISQLQSKIKGLRDDPSKAEDLGRYREAYYNFAKILFDQHAKDAEEGQYPFKQLYADGTLELGFARQAKGGAPEATKLFNDALRMFTECKAFDDGRRDQQARDVDAKFQAKVTAVQNASDAATLDGLAVAFMSKDLAEYGIDPRNMGACDTIKANQAAVKAEASPDKIAQLKKAITNGYNTLSRRVKRGLLIDPQNLWGLARCNRALKQYPKALELYSLLINGIDRSTPENEKLYWQSELEYAETSLEAKDTVPDVKKAMQSLSTRINQLKATGGDMGGLLGKFNLIQFEADKLSK
ncbi:MAG: hypothetical protein ACE15C_03045 [Phycisphaerae bacterium]